MLPSLCGHHGCAATSRPALLRSGSCYCTASHNSTLLSPPSPSCMTALAAAALFRRLLRLCVLLDFQGISLEQNNEKSQHRVNRAHTNQLMYYSYEFPTNSILQTIHRNSPNFKLTIISHPFPQPFYNTNTSANKLLLPNTHSDDMFTQHTRMGLRTFN